MSFRVFASLVLQIGVFLRKNTSLIICPLQFLYDFASGSPRRMLSLNQEVHGPKTSEVYGFVGSISIVVATVFFLIWGYVPDKFLQSIGIYYYPSKYWAMAMPLYSMVTLLIALVFYIGLNFMSTSKPTSLNTLFGESPIHFSLNFRSCLNSLLMFACCDR